MSKLASGIRYCAQAGLLCGLVGPTGCAGKVELVALTSAGGTSGAGGTSATNGASPGLCTQPGCVQPQDSGVAGAPAYDGVCRYNGSVYAAGMSFPSSDGCNSCSCSSYGAVSCTLMGCVGGIGGALSVGGAASTGGARSVGGTPSTGGVPSIVPACPGIAIASSSPDAGTVGVPDAGAFCAGIGIESDPSPIDMFVMLDRTQSMTYTLQGSALQRWDAIEQGFQKFTSNQSTRVGLNYFGKTGNPNDPAECDATSYAQAVVPIDYLSNNATVLALSVAAERAILGGQTPWYPALQGGLQFTQKWQTANPTHRAVFVFITDGYPTECDTDITHITSVVSDALQGRGLFAGGPSIYTYVIGIAVDNYNPDLVAKAGGTNQATIVDGPTAPDQLAEALRNAISLTNSPGLSCNFSLPTPPAGQVLDPSQVQVVYKPYTGNNQEIPRADSPAYCGGPNGGWYFDNPSNPTKITLCPCTCSNVAAGSVELRFGCRTHLAIN